MLFEDFPSSIDGVGEEVLSCFFTLCLTALIYGIWRTTSVDESSSPAAPPNNASTEEPRSASPSPEAPPAEPDDESSSEESISSNSGAASVRIKLKFLDERVKEVNTALSETLGRFKRKHFTEELQDSRKLIRIVFNGRFLQGDTLSLRSLGLFDNCVCHVLIHDRPTPQASASNAGQPDNTQQQTTLIAEDLDLSTLCYPLLGSLLSLIWWCQIVYGQYFNLTSTMSLIFITGLYVFCLAGQFN